MIAASFPPLLAMGAVFVAAGWLALRNSRRMARFWAAAALLVLAAANVLDIQQRAGPWWPLIERGWGLGEWLAVPVWIAALALAIGTRQRKPSWGLALVACGVAAFMSGLGAAASGHASHAGNVCLGQSAVIGQWTARLDKIEPVVGADYSGVQARLSLRSSAHGAISAAAERRKYFSSGASPRAGSAVLTSWNGELLVEVFAIPGSPECIGVALTWRSFGQWLRYGAWLTLLGALLLFASAVRSTWWRLGAIERIAMRREDQGRSVLPADPDRLAWPPVAMALACGLIAMVWQRPAQLPVPRAAIDGAALIAARQARFGGPHLTNRWMVTADAMARHGQFGDAATMLLGAVESEPDNAEAWHALGDALYGQAGGVTSPAAQLAYVRASQAARQVRIAAP